MRVAIALLVIALLGACASPQTRRVALDPAIVAAEELAQRKLALEVLLAEHQRMYDAGLPIFAAGVPYCGELVTPELGLLPGNQDSFDDAMRAAATELFDLTDQPSVLIVVNDSPAASAGFQKQDRLIALNGEELPTGEGAIAALGKLFEELPANENAIFDIERGGQPLTLSVAPDPICDFDLVLAAGDSVNAFADGERVAITRGMMRFVENPLDLQIVIAHELAHNLMHHIEAKGRNTLLGTLLDIFAGIHGVNTGGAFGGLASTAWSEDFEAEADYVGLYTMARAGLDIESAPSFWRRFAAIHPESIGKRAASTHPTTPERFLAMAEAVKEIRAKQEAGAELTPEPKNQ